MQPTSRRERIVVVSAAGLFSILKGVHAVLAAVRHDTYGVGWPRIIFSNDTHVYLAAAHAPIWSLDFLAARGPLGYALLLKVVASNLRAVLIVQTVLSCAAWIFLAQSLRRVLDHEAARTIGFLGVLATGLAVPFMIWDAAVMTESLAVALVCVVIGAALRLTVAVNARNVALFAGALAVAGFTRDVDAYVAILIGVAAMIGLLVPRARRRYARALAAVAVVTILSGGIAVGLSQHADRSLAPIADSIAVHVGGDPDAYAWFVDHGMPNDGSARRLHAGYPFSEALVEADSPSYHALHDWIATRGSRTYLEYLVTHPRWTLRAPLGSLHELFVPPLESVARFYGNDPDIVSRVIGDVGLPPLLVDGVWTLLAAIGVVVVMRRRPRGERDARVAIVLLAGGLLVIPHAMAVYHGDAFDIARHAVSNAAQARILVWIATAFVLDRVLATRSRTNEPGATTDATPVQEHAG